jgi:hypothetical protein
VTRFSVGTGKPCVFSTEILGQFTPTIQESQGCSSDDKAVAVELELYSDLYRCVVQQTLHIAPTKARFHSWKAKHKDRQYRALNNK